MLEDFNELGGLSDGSGEGGLGGLGEASMRARDAANAQDDGMSMGFDSTPQSLGDVDTQGMGEGLSAARAEMGMDNGGMTFNAGLQDEEEEAPIHAALQDEEEEAPIQAGRAEAEPIQANYGQSASSTPSEERSSFGGGYNMGSDLSQNPSQNIDDIFIAGSYGRSNNSFGSTSSTGGTMYDPNKDKKHSEVRVSFGLPPFLKNLIILAVFIVVVLGVLKYGFHMNVENYLHPVDVQEYVDSSAETLGETLGYTFKSEDVRYSSDYYDYTYNEQVAGGLKLVDCNGKRFFIEVTGFRLDCSIYGIRPQVTKFDEATLILTGLGYSEVDSYTETEELGSQGEEHCFYNQRSGEGVIIGKKAQYSSVKAIKYMKNYKQYSKTRASLRGEG
jgi:hypothetical protein